MEGRGDERTGEEGREWREPPMYLYILLRIAYAIIG